MAREGLTKIIDRVHKGEGGSVQYSYLQDICPQKNIVHFCEGEGFQAKVDSVHQNVFLTFLKHLLCTHFWSVMFSLWISTVQHKIVQYSTIYYSTALYST